MATKLEKRLAVCQKKRALRYWFGYSGVDANGITEGGQTGCASLQEAVDVALFWALNKTVVGDFLASIRDLSITEGSDLVWKNGGIKLKDFCRDRRLLYDADDDPGSL
jgi:hypothetical protein